VKLLAFVVFVVLAVAAWVALALYGVTIATGRMTTPFRDAWWVVVLPAILAVLGTWGAVRYRPRRRASEVAVEEFRRTRRRTPPP
jgi:hypothetical protein